MEAIDEEIQTRQERIDMIGENEDLAELVNPAKLRELQKEVKILEKILLNLSANKPLNIFEYGAGFSTIYFTNRDNIPGSYLSPLIIRKIR